MIPHLRRNRLPTLTHWVTGLLLFLVACNGRSCCNNQSSTTTTGGAAGNTSRLHRPGPADLRGTQLALAWLARDCPEGEHKRLELVLDSIGLVSSIESLFVSVYRNGPDSTILIPYLDNEGRMFDASRVYLMRDSSQIPLSLRDSIVNRSRGARLAELRANFIDVYRSRALIGLAIIGSDSAAAFIGPLLSDSTNVLFPSVLYAQQWIAGTAVVN